MGWPALVTLDERPDGVFLYRYTADGRFAGDTWHANIDDAKHQASFEFGDLLSEWKAIPENVEDIISYGLSPD